MRVAPGHLVFARGRREDERVLARRCVVLLAASVHEGELALRVDGEAEHLDVTQGGADLHHHEQPRLGTHELEQARFFGVTERVAELLVELRIEQELRGFRRKLREIVARVGLLEAVQREHVRDGRLRLEPDEDLEPEQQRAGDADGVARHAVVLGPHAIGGAEQELAAAELALALLIERLGLFAELRRAREQALVNDLVAAAFEGALFGLWHRLSHGAFPLGEIVQGRRVCVGS